MRTIPFCEMTLACRIEVLEEAMLIIESSRTKESGDEYGVHKPEERTGKTSKLDELNKLDELDNALMNGESSEG